MNVSTCASTDNRIKWSQIFWDKHYEVVRKLQVRIVKAQQEGRFGKVKALQWLLTHSFSAKILAVKRVTENRGKNTPGVDNQLWKTDDEKFNACKTLKLRGYKAQPLRRVYIPKKNSSKKRPLGIPTMIDRSQQALYLMALDPIAESICDPNSYGFRKSRSTADALVQVFNVFSKKDSANWVLEGDIKSCFDKISHEWILSNVTADKRMLIQWLKSGISKSILEDEVMPEIIEFMKERGLQLSPEKTVITHIDEGFDFLGNNVRKYKGKLLIKPSKNNIKTFLSGIRDVIKKNPTSKQDVLIRILNAKIQGWANYHRHQVSKQAFANVDNQIYNLLWNWSCRRHNNRSKKWISNRYYHVIGNRHWVFAAKIDNEILCLKKAVDTKIIRHTKVRSDANPYDKEWDAYFEEREGYKLFENMNGRKTLVKMWTKQNGLCPICNAKVTKATGWRMHKDDTTKVKFIVHPNCHEELHGYIQKPVEPVLSLS